MKEEYSLAELMTQDGALEDLLKIRDEAQKEALKALRSIMGQKLNDWQEQILNEVIVMREGRETELAVDEGRTYYRRHVPLGKLREEKGTERPTLKAIMDEVMLTLHVGNLLSDKEAVEISRRVDTEFKKQREAQEKAQENGIEATIDEMRQGVRGALGQKNEGIIEELEERKDRWRSHEKNATEELEKAEQAISKILKNREDQERIRNNLRRGVITYKDLALLGMFIPDLMQLKVYESEGERAELKSLRAALGTETDEAEVILNPDFWINLSAALEEEVKKEEKGIDRGKIKQEYQMEGKTIFLSAFSPKNEGHRHTKGVLNPPLYIIDAVSRGLQERKDQEEIIQAIAERLHSQ